MNPQSLRWRLPLIAFVTALSFFVVYPPFDPDGSGPKEGKLKMGLDIRGGMHLVLRVKTETLPPEERKDATERAIEVIRNRIDQFGVAEPSIQKQGDQSIVIQLPGIQDRERALQLIGKTALLEFKLAAQDQSAASKDTKEAPAAGLKVYPSKDEEFIVLEDKTLLDGKLLKDASVQFSSDWGEPAVSLSFNGEGAKIFADITSKNVNRRLAIVLDDVVQSAPNINEPIFGGNAQITGSFSIQEAGDLAIALRAGALPAPIEVAEERTVGATLGGDSVAQGIKATLLAGLSVVIFVIIYYFLEGVVASLALILNTVITGACLAYFNASLTLPGIAGIILTIGMAVDTNVLLLERIREELRLGKSLAAAVHQGYSRAFSAIFDTHLTTFSTAAILFYFGTGPVRGFATTLAVGIIASFFTGIVVTRAITDSLIHFAGMKKISMPNFFKTVPNIPFVKYSPFFMILSTVLVGFALWTIVTVSERSFGIDFSGGVLQGYRFSAPVQVSKVRESLEKIGMEKAVIQEFGSNGDEIVIRSTLGSETSIKEAIQTHFGDLKPELRRMESVGPVVGDQLKQKAFWAIAASLVFILIYLGVRFEFRYSVGAIVALFHDAAISLAAVIWTQREISITVLAAVLTIVGYSVNDTIVIFDRIREHLRRQDRSKEGLLAIMNLSLNETFSRTILTSLTVLMVVIILYVAGGPVINDFAFTMLVGLISGVYSTMYIACPVAYFFSKRNAISKKR